MSERPEVSFVIPCYGSRSTLPATLESIDRLRGGHPLEIIVVDSSGDDTPQWLRDNYPKVCVIESDSRLWPGEARNRGADRSRGQWLAFVDADAVLEPQWLEAMFSAIRSPGRQLVGGWVANANPHSAASRTLHWLEFSEYLPGLPAGERRALSSSNWLIGRRTFLDQGGFATGPRFYEDLAFCRSLGGGIYFQGLSGVRHHFREDWIEVNRHLYQLGFHSGSFRASPTSSRWGLAGLPQLSYLLLPYRLLVVPLRVARSGLLEGLRCLLHFPQLCRCLWHWTRGFRQGLGSPPGTWA